MPPDRVTERLSREIAATSPNREPLANSANVLLLTVPGCSDSEKVRTTVAFGPTPTDPFPGVMLITVGGVVSGTAAVRNQPKK